MKTTPNRIISWSVGLIIATSCMAANAPLIGVNRIDPDITAGGFDTLDYDAGSDTLTMNSPNSLLSYNSP